MSDQQQHAQVLEHKLKQLTKEIITLANQWYQTTGTKYINKQR